MNSTPAFLSSAVLLLVASMPLCADEQATDPKNPVGEESTHSEPKEKLNGEWILDNTSFAQAIIAGLKASAGNSGTSFSLDDIKGDYMATINTETGKVLVDWKNWEMHGTAKTQRAGTFPVVVNLNGQQEYRIASINESDKPSKRTMNIVLVKDGARAKVSFRGMVTKTKMDLPTLGTGSWAVHDDVFTLASEGHTWKFTRRK